MIDFRCWYCGKRYAMAEKRKGERFTCACQSRLRVPGRSGGKSRARTLGEWLIESLVYGGGGALVGLGLSLFLLSEMRFFSAMRYGWIWIVGFTLVGFLAGAIGGESGINWIGQKLRDRETDP